MSWHQFSINSAKDRIEAVEDMLLLLGAVSVTLRDAADQPLLEPLPGETPTWDDSIVVGLFDKDTNTDFIRGHLQKSLSETEAKSLAYEFVEDQQWELAWTDSFDAMSFGERLWVVPSHIEAPQPDAVNLVLDPGLAFGTGTHPTTALCLEWLDGLTLDNKIVMDFGCGSGILAIAALLLGAQKTYVTDIDPQAIESTQSNAEQNKVANGIEVLDTDATPEQELDVFVANILAGPLEELAPHFARLCKPGTQLALSGILKEQEESIRTCYSEWFELDATRYQDDWILVSGVRR